MLQNKAIAVTRDIIKLLKDNCLVIRPYEGETSCCVIEALDGTEMCIIPDPSRYDCGLIVAYSTGLFTFEEIANEN